MHKHLYTFIAAITLSVALMQGLSTEMKYETAQPVESPLISIFSPGFADKTPVGARQAARLAKNNIIQGSYTTCTYNDDRQHANFGQMGDIETLSDHVRGCCNAAPDMRILLAGISRGASTLFTFLSKKKPTNIAAVIAESPFAALNDVIQHRIGQWNIGWLPGAQKLALLGMLGWMKVMYPAYTLSGIQPATSIQKHSLQTPILIACSKQDDIVPHTSSIRLAQQLKEHGYENVYLLVFKDGSHGFLSYKDEFQQVANAMYAQHNLPHNHELATLGAHKLEHYKL